MKYYISEIKYLVNSVLSQVSEEGRDLYSTLQENGYVIVPDFISRQKCATLRDALEEHITRPYAWRDDHDSDARVFGIDRVSSAFNGLFDTPILSSIYKKHIDRKSLHQFIMANRVRYKENNLGSGGGWHRDVINRRQLKFITYLNDVGVDNGCFQYLVKTHTIGEKWKINRRLGKTLSEFRYSESDVEKLLQQGYKCADLTGEAGTLIIVDTSGIHRGRPVKEGGIRYAATQYMSDIRFGEHINKMLAFA